MNVDEFYMTRCFELAQKGAGLVAPNPLVGCVLVKNGQVLAQGFHKKIGGPHAEIDALEKINFRAEGATLYCNLEPCFHQGRTPPCINKVIESGIKRAVIAMEDPNPKVAGASIRALSKAGITVSVGILQDIAEHHNRFFIKWIKTGRPYVILKVAQSLDGCLDHKNKSAKKIFWITGEVARHRVHQLRSELSAVAVGVGTIISDDARLNVRLGASAPQPSRIIFDSRLRTPKEAAIFQARGGAVLIFSTVKGERQGAEIIHTAKKGGRVDLEAALKTLGQRGISSLLLEGGNEIYSSFLDEGLVDEVINFVAPKVLGATGLAFAGRDKLKQFRNYQATTLGKDIEYRNKS